MTTRPLTQTAHVLGKITPKAQRIIDRLITADHGHMIAVEYLARWMRQQRPYGDPHDWPWLFGKRGPRAGASTPPGYDHGGSEVDADGRRWITYQPYHLSSAVVSSLLEWCDARSLEFYITGFSPHFPTQTVIVKIAAKPGATYTQMP